MKYTICLFGDSITWGAIDNEKGGWGARLQNFLIRNNYDTRIYNCGISGDNSDALLRRFNVECNARNPDIIIFAIGINDSQYVISQKSIAVPINRYIENLNALIKCAKQTTKTILFLGITNIDESKTVPVEWNPDKQYLKKNINVYNEKLKKTVESNNCMFIEMIDLLNECELYDGVHPNSKGHQKIFLRVKNFIISNKLIKEN